MKALDLQLQEFHVAKAICHFLKGFDFIIGSLQWIAGRAVEIIVGKVAKVLEKRLSIPIPETVSSFFAIARRESDSFSL
uniref:Uncharacterized protein n=1 Tax=Candidatus Kentrum sp. TC TaxID=2126339 RepID=A0A450Y787_9GAMM|nr:MAG: hypothetical protein BECKTC1821D_GA0114238_100161 [Candidatus Kentron sp. TC]